MKVYFNEEEVRLATLAYFNGDALATNVWMTKYALRNGDDFSEKTPDDSIKRYTEELYRIESKYANPTSKEEIYRLMKNYKYFIFAGSPMFGVGNNLETVSLGNCFFYNNREDSYTGIMRTDHALVQIMKRRGGVGIDISHLRPSGAATNNAAKTSTGAVSFMSRFSNTTREVAQSGRRGALMITIDVTHPDIMDFITVKDDLSAVTGANVSVKVTDEFMVAVKDDTDFTLKFGEQSLTVKAKKIWDAIIHQAWKTAEPGVLFWDHIIRESPADCYIGSGFKTEGVNPCSELTLSHLDSCRLSSMNVYSYVNQPFTKEAEMDFTKLFSDTRKAQRMMDNVINLELEKIDTILAKIESNKEEDNSEERSLWLEIRKNAVNGRRTGLGETGVADAGAALGLKYGSKEFIEFAELVQEVIAKASYAESINMAEERGAFPVFKLTAERDHPFIKRILKDAPEEVREQYAKYGRRNIANLAIAPTGSLSILAQVSSGIEPVFLLEYERRRKVTKDTPGAIKDEVGDYWEEYTVLHPKYQDYIDITGNTDESPYDGATANEIDYMSKVEMQGLMQRYCDHSISVTHNLPNDVKESVIEDIYMKAWESGCKGVTVYRDGSRDGVLKAKEIKEIENFIINDAPKRPRNLDGEAFSTSVRGEKFTVIIGLFNGRPYEVFAYKGNGLVGKGTISKIRKGSYKFSTEDREENITDDLTEEQEAITRGYSFGLRHGGHVKFATEQLNKTKGDLSSFTKAIARVLKKFVPDGEISSERCLECNHRLEYESNCHVCKNCGWSKCD